MRTRLTATLALLAVLFSALFVIGNSSAGAQEIREDEPTEEQEKKQDDKKKKDEKTIAVCKLEGIDWVLYEFDVEGAEYWLKNGAVLAGPDGCHVRVCEEKTGQQFTYWTSYYATPSDAAWTTSTSDAYVAKPGVPCPGNEPVSICVNSNKGWIVESMAPDAAEWVLFTGQGTLLVDGKCPEPEPEPEPTPTPEQPTPTPEEPTPVPEEQPTPPDGDEKSEGDTAVPPAPEQPTQPDAAVQGNQETAEELAVTGAESSDLALYGALLLATGIGLVTISRRRLNTIGA